MTTEKNKASDEAHIRRQIDTFVKAFRSRDVNLMMSLYAPGMVSFDLVPPLEDSGKDVYRKVWKQTFASFDGPIDIEIRDLGITTSDSVAFSHKLLHINVMDDSSQRVDFWERLTFCFCKIDNQWLIAHEHVSVPADFDSGLAMLELKP